MVPMTGVEPVRYHYHRILSPARLPIPPHRHCNFTTFILYYKNFHLSILFLKILKNISPQYCRHNAGNIAEIINLKILILFIKIKQRSCNAFGIFELHICICLTFKIIIKFFNNNFMSCSPVRFTRSINRI